MAREAGQLQSREPPLSQTRLVLLLALFSTAYLTMPWWVQDGTRGNAWLLVAAALVGAAVGVTAGIVELKRPGGERRSRRRAGSGAGFLVAATGAALLLGRLLDASAIPWLLLGTIVMVTVMLFQARTAASAPTDPNGEEKPGTPQDGVK